MTCNYRVNWTNLTASNWWCLVVSACDQFFDSSAAFGTELLDHQVTGVLMQLEEARHTVEHTPYPPQVAKARRELLKAMTSLTSGFAASLGGNTDVAANFAQRSYEHLGRFNAELDQLGIY